MPAQGKFITLEGGEGAGKSTQATILAQKLREIGLEVVETREPDGPICDLLVNGDAEWDPRSEALLHFAARAQHLAEVVRPALDAGQWVVCDRFADSTMAYQGVVQGAGADFINGLYDLVVGETGPDLTLIFDLPIEVGLARAGARMAGEDRYEKMGADFHHRLREAFTDIANQHEDRCVLLNAHRPIDVVSAHIWQVTRERLDLT